MSLSDAEIGSGSFRTAILAFGEGLIVELAGELDLAGVPALREALDTVLLADAERIVLDFGALTFIDSSGIATLVEALARCTESGRRLGVCEVTGQVRRVLELVDVMSRLQETERPSGAVRWPLDSPAD